MHTDTRQFLAQRPARSERPAHRSCCYDSAMIGTTPALRELASSSRGCPTFLHEASSLVEGEGSQENTAVGRAAGEEEEGIWEPADEVFRDRLLTLAVAEAFFFLFVFKEHRCPDQKRRQRISKHVSSDSRDSTFQNSLRAGCAFPY